MNMGKDFYKMLGLPRGATDYEIRVTYRMLAQSFHPDMSQNPHAAERFEQLAEAFEVLSDKKKRELFDALGEEGLQQTGYQFQGNPYATYAKVLNSYDVDFPLLPKNSTVEHVLLITLEDILKGCIKRLEISQRRISFTGRAIQESKMLNVEIRPGWKAGTRITFPGEGDEVPNRRPGDVVFVLREKPHHYFRREGCDLLYTAKISLRQALSGLHFLVPTLQGGILPVNITDDIITADTVRRFPGQGLPHQVNGSRRGDLIVNFVIDFPETVPEEVKFLL
ncbi:dnaJ protein homolog 1 [Drosophila subpulchrella]|uniref:dnaJ protein homolog 1 n=1 Tax=Drosophila subpulchrella TaxID=1486046 RepID=UPI0018A1946B|nr:dnaJ protein homolog 1 [Drosophila subpulchrella]